MATHPSYPDEVPGLDLPGAADRLGSASAGARDFAGPGDGANPPVRGGAEGGPTSRAPRSRAAARPRAGQGEGQAVNSSPRGTSNPEEKQREAAQDRELILQAQKGDHAAFRRLVERHQRRAFSVALGLVRDPNDARELVQEAFLRVYRGLGSFQGGSSFYTWLYRIITNLAIDAMRKPGRREVELYDRHASGDDAGSFPLVSRIDGSDPIDVIRRRELAARIQSALDELPPYHRSVILMREVEGMSYEEMAQATGVSAGTIMSRLFHARKKLQRALADCYERGGGRAAAPLDDDETPEDIA